MSDIMGDTGVIAAKQTKEAGAAVAKQMEAAAVNRDAAVRVNKLKFAYPGGKSILRDVSFEVKKGTIFVIAGHSGCGKSTLCNIISGIIPNSVKGSVSGNVEVLGKNMRGRSLAENARHVGFVFQNVDLQFVCTTVEDELAFGLENLCVEPSKIRKRVDDILREWDLEQFRLRNPGSLSGGQKRIVAMASVLILNPDILILDEPMSHLDEQGREIVKKAAVRIRDEGKTVIMVEHDLSLAEYADYWLLIDNGRVAAQGTPAELKSKPDILERLEFI